MAEDKWKEGIRKNFATIIKGVGNPVDLVEYFHHTITPPLLNDDQARKIKDMTGTKKDKTRSLLNTLMYRDDRVLTELVKALHDTGNEDLAKLLEPYEKERKRKLHLPLEAWPPLYEDLDEMHKAEAEHCDINGAVKSGYAHTEVYTMTAKRRGLAVIINNANFKSLPKRSGTDQDRDKLSRVLSQLHFDVKIYNNMDSADMQKIAEESSKWGHHKESDCFVLAVLSHGCTTGVCGTDDSVVHVKDIVQNFNINNCPELKGKPKVFLLQACRSLDAPRKLNQDGNQSGEYKHDSMETNTEPEASYGCYGDDDGDVGKAVEYALHKCNSDPTQDDGCIDEGPRQQIPKVSHPCSDFFFAYATPDGFKAYRSEKRGSWFIQAIVWVLKYNANKEHLHDLMTKVNKYVSYAVSDDKSTQVSEMRSTLQKKLYFFPGVFNDPPEKNDYIEEPVTVGKTN